MNDIQNPRSSMATNAIKLEQMAETVHNTSMGEKPKVKHQLGVYELRLKELAELCKGISEATETYQIDHYACEIDQIAGACLKFKEPGIQDAEQKRVLIDAISEAKKNAKMFRIFSELTKVSLISGVPLNEVIRVAEMFN